jgi:polyisoprenoid-binding protein YceI
MRLRTCFTAALAASSLSVSIAQPRAIDTKTSVVTVKVFKSGVFSAFAHDHLIDAPITSGTTDPSAHRVELHINTAAMRVRDPKASQKDRDEIQKTMLGPDVLDTGRFSEIVFRSTAAEPAGSGSWTVRGTLQLHGQSQPVTLTATENSGHYSGQAALKLTDFGIQPIKVAGGTVKVKDEIQIEFDIQVTQ